MEVVEAMLFHVIAFTVLCVLTLITFGNDYKRVSRAERRYMHVEKFETWGNEDIEY